VNDAPRRSPALKLWLGLLLAALLGYTGYSLARIYRLRSAGAADGPAVVAQPIVGQVVRPFRLVDRNGQEFDSAALAGRPWVASFFYARCAGECLIMNNALGALQTELDDVPGTFVSITVDPVHDTPEALRNYAARFSADPARWVFLTGDAATIERVATEDFHVAYATAVHSDRLILVDAEGRVVRHYSSKDPAQVAALKRDLRRLAEEAP
jgi:cytochrome oxidase Cu insertion factor (SCO1/SenC/PrrC family)